jgi:hypothetical protein
MPKKLPRRPPFRGVFVDEDNGAIYLTDGLTVLESSLSKDEARRLALLLLETIGRLPG